MRENRLPERFLDLWNEHAVVVTGVRTHGPTLSFACVDHHALVLEAMTEALNLGYRRPALVLAKEIDRLVEGRFSAGFWTGQGRFAARSRIPGYDEVESTRAEPGRFTAWLDRYKPDVIFTLHTVVREWLKAAGYRVPEDVGLCTATIWARRFFRARL
jgi:DNA-binding LacI/PurR family transcriptional regulator